MGIAGETRKVYKHIKKTMSMAAKTPKYQKNNEHSNENETGVQTHQKTHEHTIKNKKRSKKQ